MDIEQPKWLQKLESFGCFRELDANENRREFEE